MAMAKPNNLSCEYLARTNEPEAKQEISNMLRLIINIADILIIEKYCFTNKLQRAYGSVGKTNFYSFEFFRLSDRRHRVCDTRVWGQG